MKGLIYNASIHLHLFDHVVPFSYMMQWSLLYTQSHLVEKVKKYYPQKLISYIPSHEVSYEKLANEYDLFVQALFWKENLFEYFAELLKKSPTFCYLSHGESDKGHLDEKVMNGLSLQEVAFFSGKQSKDRLIAQGQFAKIAYPIFVGNVRKRFYHAFQSFYDTLTEKEIFSKLPSKNLTLLYAPTWNDIEENTSFFDITETLIEKLPDHWNLIIKPHPYLEEENPALFYHYLWKASQKPNVILLQDFPNIYPLLKRCNAYLGDFSSIGYDAITFQMPLFFYDPFQRPLSHPCKALHECGITLQKKDFSQLFTLMNRYIKNFPKSLLEKQKKRELYTFGKDEPLIQTRKKILTALEKVRKKTLSAKGA